MQYKQDISPVAVDMTVGVWKQRIPGMARAKETSFARDDGAEQPWPGQWQECCDELPSTSADA